MRLENFKASFLEIQKLKKDSTVLHEVGINHLADLTKEEYRKLLGYKSQNPEQRIIVNENVKAIPIDWV